MLNKLKAAIEKNKYALGTFLGVANPSVVEIMGYTGLDFVVIDTEHGPYDTMPMSDLIQAAESRGLSPLVRIADLTHKEMQRALDNGAEGIIIPCLKDVYDFRKVVDLGKFAPLGNRGFIKGRGSGFGNEPWASGAQTEYMQNSNDKVLLLPQCETKEALENIEEIVRIEGIDGIFIGPFDLSICMGIPGQFDAPEFKDAVDRILLACKQAGKLCMTFTGTPAESRMYIEKGFDAVAYSIDTIVIGQAYKSIVEEIRG